MRIKSLVSVAAAAVLLSGCGSSGSKSSALLGGSVGTDDSYSDLSTTTSTTMAQSAPIAIGTTLTDPELGQTVVVKNVVRNFSKFDHEKWDGLARGEVVLVEVEANPGTKYYSGISSSSFRVLSDDGTKNVATSVIDSDVEAAGYTPFPLSGSGVGKTVDAWLVMKIADPGQTKLQFDWYRLSTKVIGGATGETIPAKDFTVALPNA